MLVVEPFAQRRVEVQQSISSWPAEPGSPGGACGGAGGARLSALFCEGRALPGRGSRPSVYDVLHEDVTFFSRP